MVFKLPTSYIAIKASRWEKYGNYIYIYIFIIHNQLIWVEGNSKTPSAGLIPRNKSKIDWIEMGLGGQTLLRTWKIMKNNLNSNYSLTNFLPTPWISLQAYTVFSWLHSGYEGHILEAGMAAAVEEWVSSWGEWWEGENASG